jgi:IclR family transcriptional regulator, KDG regulon repressor
VVTRALARGLNVLEALAAADADGLGPTAIAATVDLDKATVARLLQTLVTTGYVTKDPVTRRCHLTAKILRVAQGVSARLDLLSSVRPHLRRLRDELNETVHLGVMEDLRVVYLDKLESTNSIQLVSAVGQTMPLHSTSLGKALLAALPDTELEETLARIDFAPRTERTICDMAGLRAEIKRTRQRGYATDDRENEPLGACVAAAIIGANGRPVGAISVAGPHFRIRDHFEPFGQRVRATAAAIALELGGTGLPSPAEE